MRRSVIIAGGIGVFAISLVGWYNVMRPKTNPLANSSGGSIALAQDSPSPRPSQGANSLSVVTPVPGTNTIPITQSQAAPVHATSRSATSLNDDGFASEPRSKLPDPAGFGVYDSYADKDSAFFADITPGTGPDVKMGSKVAVNYRGWLTNGTEFDESYNRGKPYVFEEGAHAVILGWEQAIFGMKVGGKRRFIVPPKVGYGSQAQGSIPANSLLVFDVELLAVE